MPCSLSPFSGLWLQRLGIQSLHLTISTGVILHDREQQEASTFPQSCFLSRLQRPGFDLRRTGHPGVKVSVASGHRHHPWHIHFSSGMTAVLTVPQESCTRPFTAGPVWNPFCSHCFPHQVTVLQRERKGGTEEIFPFVLDESLKNTTIYITGTSLTFTLTNPRGNKPFPLQCSHSFSTMQMLVKSHYCTY